VEEKGGMMETRGISGFTVVFLILLFAALIYIGYSIGSVWFRVESLKEKVKEVMTLNPTASDSYYLTQMIEVAREAGVELTESDIYIDRSIPDSILTIIEYPDSAVLPLFTYRRLQHIEIIVPSHAK
jgi:Na+-transporting methylmalonyl-CoA/oxaloacetate decarboxylase gamma subunit